MQNCVTDYSDYKKLLKERLTEKRYIHSLAVADESYRLAELYGADAQKAYLAGLLHDVTKNASQEEHLHIFDTFGIMLNSIESQAQKLWHAISGSLYVRYILNVDDEEIIDAIRYHTTAKSNMSLLAKVLYLADFTSADRDYEDVDVMRNLVNKSMNDAYRYALSYSILELVESGRAVHTDTLAAYNESVMKGSK